LDGRPGLDFPGGKGESRRVRRMRREEVLAARRVKGLEAIGWVVINNTIN
jgi:hypothetical protein